MTTNKAEWLVRCGGDYLGFTTINGAGVLVWTTSLDHAQRFTEAAATRLARGIGGAVVEDVELAYSNRNA